MASAPGILIHEVYSGAQKSEFLINTSVDFNASGLEIMLESWGKRTVSFKPKPRSSKGHPKENFHVEESYTKGVSEPHHSSQFPFSGEGQ